jgi:hypothetical protein
MQQNGGKEIKTHKWIKKQESGGKETDLMTRRGERMGKRNDNGR